MSNILRVATTLSFLCAAAMPAVQARELSAPFPVPISRAGQQSPSRCTAGGNGDVLIAWSDGARGNAYFMRRYDVAGQPLQSDDWFLGYNLRDVAVNRLGDYAVLVDEADGTGKSAYITVYKRDGSLKIPKFKVNTTPASLLLNAVLAYGPSGRLVVFWGDAGGSTQYLYARTFDTNGTPLSPTVTIASSTTPIGGYDVAMAANDSYAVVWSDLTPTADLYTKRLSVGGTTLANTSRVNTYTNAGQGNGQLAMNAAGATIITWESNGQDGSGLGVYGQRYDSAGLAVGGEFRLNDATEGSQTDSHLGITAEGNFVSVWATNTSPPGGNVPVKVYLRQFRADGTPASPDTLIYAPQTGTATSWFPYVAVDPAGYATVAWYTYLLSDPVDAGEVYARRYVLDTQPAVGGLTNGIPVRSLSGAAGSWRYYRVIVPSGKTTLTIEMTGSASATGNADIYVSLGGLPTQATAEVRSVNATSNDTLVLSNVPPGAWYIGVHGASAYTGASIRALY